MPSQPFTPTGVAAKTTELYALSNTLLAAQADAVESDFRGWMRSNFSLSGSQDSFLTGINDHAAKYYGAQCSVAFRARLTVSLVVGGDFPPSTKWIKAENTLIVSSNAAGALETSGSLTFKIEYRS